MVRPIDITDSLSKVDIVEKMQSLQKLQPEAAQQFQKSLTDKLTHQVTTPNPVPKSDHVVIHTEERERENEYEEDDTHHSQNPSDEGENDEGGGDDFHGESSGHIDIIV